ncbi:V-type ATPase 116kDa subunit family protein [Caldivirga maquilingensis]|uniref:V-type ATPase 116kDa subunit family protein n=1 Tax=Caldivirga maquilingensis TaxID=76887 RepID=UPI0018DCEBB0|nr:V-type ATPase 116kDa subunit family protein [Caldivirga maquilingensis]
MPIERIVEYKITVPRHAALDLIFRVGLLGEFMPIDRPPKLPAPSIDQETYTSVRRLTEAARTISRYGQTQQEPSIGRFRVKATSFKDFIDSVYKNGEELIGRIRQIEDSLNNAEEELTKLRLMISVNSLIGLMQLKNIRYIVVETPHRALSDFENSIKQIEDVVLTRLGEVNDRIHLLIIAPTWELRRINDIIRLHNVKVIELPESDLSNVEARVKETEATISSLRSQLESLISSNKQVIRGILEAAGVAENVIQTYVNSAVEEGGEVIARIDAIKTQMVEMESRLSRLRLLIEAYNGLIRSGIKEMGLKALDYSLFIIKGQIPPDLDKYSGYVINIGDELSAYLIMSNVDYPESNNIVKAPREHLTNLEASVELLSREIREMERRLGELKNELNEMIREREEACNYSIEEARQVSDLVTIRGFVIEKNVKLFEDFLYRTLTDLAVDARVRKFTRIIQVNTINPHEAPTSEEYPTPINAFREITYMYGIPRYGELSPVTLTAVLFPVFFGWMFPDAGQGAILLLFGILMNVLKYNGRNSILRAMFSGKANLWGQLFVMMGTWAIVFSILNSGEVFGMDLIKPILPWGRVFVNGTISEYWINWVLPLAMLFGFTLLVMSLILKPLNRARLGHRLDALSLAWVPLVFIGFGLLMMNVGIIPVALLNPVFSALLTPQVRLIGAALMVIGFGGFFGSFMYIKSMPNTEVDAAELMVGLTIEGILDAIANTLSFMRLGIIALVHSIFTYMTYHLALTYGLLTPAGLLIMILLNALIIAGEGFLTFIQTSRLTFYEVYSKFYEGSGKLYMPLRYALTALSIELP